MKTNDSSLTGRVAVITGASSGIGAATARALAARGASVALLARRYDRLLALRAEIIEQGGRAEVWPVDVTDRAAVDSVAAEVARRLGSVDIVVNNAGVMLPNPIEARRDDQWQRQLDLNVGGVLNVIGAFTPALVSAAAGPRGTDLVNVSSIVARSVLPAFAVYAGTKAFVSQLSLTLRAELGAKGVRVSAIEPGIVATELASHVDFEPANAWLADVSKRIEFLQPEDVADAIAFVVGAPKRMNVQQITVVPTAQP